MERARRGYDASEENGGEHDGEDCEKSSAFSNLEA